MTATVTAADVFNLVFFPPMPKKPLKQDIRVFRDFGSAMVFAAKESGNDAAIATGRGVIESHLHSNEFLVHINRYGILSVTGNYGDKLLATFA